MHRSRTARCARRGLAASLAVGALLTALTTATPAFADTSTAAAQDSRVVCTSRTPGLAPALSRDIARALAPRQGDSALALYDRHTRTHCEFNSHARFDSASVVKVTVLGALLRQAEEAHRELTPDEVKLTTAMITKSDNASTSTLWRRIGPGGIKHFLALAHLRHTVPGPGTTWGLTQTTAGDQLALMQLLTTENPVLSPASRGYALGLMRHVAPDQRWGVPAGTPATATTEVKNGWLPRATDGWRVHSIGSFTGHGHDYGMAVLSSGNRTMGDGITTIEGASRVIHRDLSRTPSPASR
ncbi:serine hydrolase [Streptomyces pinistramenti]|uniref:serine hydrolase n=1 Tax=Streptomyces pinistramenti TaxID=2884812 RepID=UPI001D067D54|nr:serine hydrolase [Streptomyces pinistramenti]MCB5907391.1 class A beta-lactamase-related serine hydrolase [Streptomyces pinistramenti]